VLNRVAVGWLLKPTTEHDRTALARQIAATDDEIDQLVYQLYGLTAQEIEIVEEATKR
jgi:hypothetical protein